MQVMLTLSKFQVEVLEYLAFTYYSQGKLRRALRYTNELLKLDPEHPRATGNKVYYEDTLKNQKEEERRKGIERNSTFLYLNF